MLCFLASKGAVEQISRVLAKDLGAKGITVNTVSPGPLDTAQFREGKSQKWIDFFSKQSPSNRLGLPEDVAPLVAFLSSPAAQWINGQNIRVNGVSLIFFLQYIPASDDMDRVRYCNYSTVYCIRMIFFVRLL
jgi:3-oxoacyl-[acyl-carrier protein] reductase